VSSFIYSAAVCRTVVNPNSINFSIVYLDKNYSMLKAGLPNHSQSKHSHATNFYQRVYARYKNAGVQPVKSCRNIKRDCEKVESGTNSDLMRSLVGEDFKNGRVTTFGASNLTFVGIHASRIAGNRAVRADDGAMVKFFFDVDLEDGVVGGEEVVSMEVQMSPKASARDSSSTHRSSESFSNNRDGDEGNSSSNEDANEAAASEPPTDLLDDDVLPPVITSSSAAFTYYPPPLPRRSQRRKFGSSGARRDEKLIGEFCCFICTRLIFRAQVMRPCGCHVFCEECVPPLESRTSACSTCSTPLEQALPYRTGNNIAEQMVRAKFVKADVAAEWRNRGAEYARENGNRR
jgi:hypothetical protein